MDRTPIPSDRHQRFPTTQWTAVLAVRAADPQAARAGLDQLCRRYWPPILDYFQRRGVAPVAAEELAQSFLTRALAKAFFRQADPARGRFRALLITALQNFLIDEFRRPQLATVALTGREHERPTPELSPDREFDRRWAEALLERCLAALEQDYARRGRLELFLRLEPCLQDRARQAVSHAALAAEFGLTEGAVKAEVYRMRQRFRLLVREEIAATVTTTAEVEDELRHLFGVFAK